MRGINPEFIVALIAGALGLATLALVPYQVPGESLAAIRDLGSPAFFPILAGGLMGVCAVILAVRSIASERANQGLRLEFPRPGSVLMVMAIFVVFAIGTYYVGLIPSSVVAIAAMAWVLGYRDLKIMLPVAILVPAGIYLLFQKLLLVILPGGVLLQ